MKTTHNQKSPVTYYSAHSGTSGSYVRLVAFQTISLSRSGLAKIKVPNANRTATNPKAWNAVA